MPVLFVRVLRDTWRDLSGGLKVLVVFVGILLTAELICRVTLGSTALADRPIDIQTADALCSKVERVRGYAGPKILILGDSLAYGAALGEHGDTAWREHDLASAVRRAFIRDHGTIAIAPLVMNLGLNGGLPADQLRVLRMFEGIPLDAVIATAAIRSYSADFAAPATAYSRPWLGNLSTDALPGCRLRIATDARGDAWIGRQAGRISALYRSRGLIQANLFGGSLRGALHTARTSLKHKPGVQSVVPGGSPDLMASLGAAFGTDMQTLMLAKTRFQKITFLLPHAQVDATRALIAETGRRAAKSIFIYGSENPKILPQLLSTIRYQQARESLKALFAERPGNVVFLDSLKPAAKDYLDYVHVNRTGYAMMADEIVKVLKTQANP